ncbi:copper resistance protein [Pantoea stewartii subsp. stewartii]|nr:copper resistance protein [Pantoea stewartii subsp. stewartii]
MFHTLMSIINDGHYCQGAGGKRTDGLNATLTFILILQPFF